jgi:hypothetical protein
MRRLWRRFLNRLTGRDRMIRRRLGLLALLPLLALVGCTRYAHTPPVPYAQHRIDIEACRVAANPPVYVSIPGRGAVVAAANGAALVADLVSDWERTQREFACMRGRGYEVRGLTFRRDGWVP